MRIIWRMLVIITAYICGVVGLFASIVLLFGLASLSSAAPGYWTLTAVTPAIVAGAPVVGAFLVVAAIVLSGIPALLIVGMAEVFAWRSLSIYFAPSATLAAVVYWVFSPRTIGGLDEVGWIELALFAVSGAVAGSIYWLIAGRKAGAWRR